MGYGKIKVNEDFQNMYPERMDMFLEFLMDKEWDMKKLDSGDVEFIIQGKMFNGKAKDDAEEYLILFDEQTGEMAFRKEEEIVTVDVDESE